MTRKVLWNRDALPLDVTLDRVLYEVRCSTPATGCCWTP